MSNPITEKCETLHKEGLSISSVRITVQGGTLRVSISINMFVPLGEGGDLPHHKVSIDYKKCPSSVKISGWERYPNEEFILCGNDEQAEALIHGVATEGAAVGIAKIGDDWITKPNKWFFFITHDGRKIDRTGNTL